MKKLFGQNFFDSRARPLVVMFEIPNHHCNLLQCTVALVRPGAQGAHPGMAARQPLPLPLYVEEFLRISNKRFLTVYRLEQVEWKINSNSLHLLLL
jgi:hypothetical protein